MGEIVRRVVAEEGQHGHGVAPDRPGGAVLLGLSLKPMYEFVGRFRQDRRSLPSISLTENMASVTAIGNDYAFEQIFSRQLEGLAQAQDVAVGLSTSGNSANVLAGLRTARTIGMVTVGLTGGTGGKMPELCDICICAPSKVTARIQELHLTIGHVLCELAEDALAAGGAP